jgi:uncharacterized membrane protein
VALGTLLTATYFQTCLSSRLLASNFISPTSWHALSAFSLSTATVRSDPNFVNLPFTFMLIPCCIVTVLAWTAGTIWLVIYRGTGLIDAAIIWGWYGWLWWCFVDVWEWLWILAGATGPSSLVALLSVTPQFWLAGCLAGWMTTLMTLGASSRAISLSDDIPLRTRWLWLACGVYFIVFTTMNWRLYFNLLVPHGDSVMYEEHLWNLLHGKGFRSYLDRGLFLGEHIQFVHLFLLPVYILWPSHLLLEACSSLALALGAFPVFWMARRHTGSDRVAFAVAVAYLLYFPMQFLDIEIDLKTFRPESFGIPLLLLTLDQLDRGHLVGTLLGIGFCLTVKEDYALVFGPLGLWIALDRKRGGNGRTELQDGSQRVASNSRPSRILSSAFFGLSLGAFSVIYLYLATRVVMPWFRSGVEVHYASYFSRFGKTPEEILTTWITKPGSVIEALLTLDTALYAMALLAPLAFLPLLAPSRLAVGLPLFAILCMNELDASRTPQHQFHAPLVAIVFWSLAAALPVAASTGAMLARRFGRTVVEGKSSRMVILRHLVWTSSLATGIFFSLSPLGLPFWDSGSSWSWQKLYGHTHRAIMFARIENQIPINSRVASTDFVHPRFTHYDRSYDYSDYQREVSGTGKRIPDDTEYVIIDTDHKYSKLKHPNEIPELRDHPEQWELLPDKTEGVFIILKRKTLDDGQPRSE